MSDTHTLPLIFGIYSGGHTGFGSGQAITADDPAHVQEALDRLQVGKSPFLVRGYAPYAGSLSVAEALAIKTPAAVEQYVQDGRKLDLVLQFRHPNLDGWLTFIRQAIHRYSSITKSIFRLRLVGWKNYAQEALAVFRAKSRLVVDDPHVIRLIDELERVSPEIRLWWPQHDMRAITASHQKVRHPQAGRLIFDHLSFQVSPYPHLRLCIWLPDPSSDTMERLEELLEREDAEVC